MLLNEDVAEWSRLGEEGGLAVVVMEAVVASKKLPRYRILLSRKSRVSCVMLLSSSGVVVVVVVGSSCSASQRSALPKLVESRKAGPTPEVKRPVVVAMALSMEMMVDIQRGRRKESILMIVMMAAS